YKTQREISQKLNISRSYVSRIEKKALKKLRKELKSEKSLE
ncbi:sigma factor-like helix-turn-helix DNA-binding protein, partial [Terrisporobacter hibernicus]